MKKKCSNCRENFWTSYVEDNQCHRCLAVEVAEDNERRRRESEWHNAETVEQLKDWLYQFTDLAPE